jgi:hypothetical protein
MFWDDYVPPTEKKEKPKREPPDPVWLRPDYLPWLDEARSYQINTMSDYEIVSRTAARGNIDLGP